MTAFEHNIELSVFWSCIWTYSLWIL